MNFGKIMKIKSLRLIFKIDRVCSGTSPIILSERAAILFGGILFNTTDPGATIRFFSYYNHTQDYRMACYLSAFFDHRCFIIFPPIVTFL